MITLSNGHRIDYVVASGALAFDGKGWPWERPLVWLGLIEPELFTVVIKTLTRKPREGNLRWWKPWDCVRLIPGGAVNKVGLTNPGIDWWCEKIGPNLDPKIPIVGSIFGDQQELVEMAEMLNPFNLVGLEVNPSCPNTGHALHSTQHVIDDVKAVKSVSRHPIIVKVGANQDYLSISRELVGTAEAISLNSVPWHMVFPKQPKSPLWKLEKRVEGGMGGVSGKPAQGHNWEAVEALARLARLKGLPVIGPGIMEFEDMNRVRERGAQAVSFGAIHLRTPWKPTQFVRKEINAKYSYADR